MSEPAERGEPRTPGWSVAVYGPDASEDANAEPRSWWYGEARNAADALRIAYLARRLEQQDAEQPGGDYPPAQLRDERPAEPVKRPRRQRTHR